MLSSIDYYIKSLNNSKYFAGIMILILNIGSRFIQIRLSDSAEKYIKYSLIRELLIFSIVWMGTRDIYIAFGLTACFVVLSDYILNVDSGYCLLPDKLKKITKLMDENNDGKISDSEVLRAMDILEKAKKQKNLDRNINLLNYFDNFKN
jgi:hypothetical protein